MKERIYSSEEINQIIRRAVELGSKQNSKDKNKAGLTLNELEEIVADTGIDPQLLEIAANELDGKASDRPKNRGKTKLRNDEIIIERWVDGTLDSEQIEMLLSELNNRFSVNKSANWWDNLFESYEGKARVKETQKTTEWIYTDSGGHYTTRVFLQERGERTRIRFSRTNEWSTWGLTETQMLIPSPFMIVGGGLLGYFVFDAVLYGILAGFILSLFLYPLPSIFRRSISEQEQELSELADEISDFFEELAKENNYKRRSKSFGSSHKIKIEDEEPSRSSGSSSSRLRNELR